MLPEDNYRLPDRSPFVPWLSSSDHTDLIAQLLHQLLRDFRGRTLKHLSFFAFLRDVELLDLLHVVADRGLHLIKRNFAERLVLGLLDAQQRGVTQFIDA